MNDPWFQIITTDEGKRIDCHLENCFEPGELKELQKIFERHNPELTQIFIKELPLRLCQAKTKYEQQPIEKLPPSKLEEKANPMLNNFEKTIGHLSHLVEGNINTNIPLGYGDTIRGNMFCAPEDGTGTQVPIETLESIKKQAQTIQSQLEALRNQIQEIVSNWNPPKKKREKKYNADIDGITISIAGLYWNIFQKIPSKKKDGYFDDLLKFCFKAAGIKEYEDSHHQSEKAISELEKWVEKKFSLRNKWYCRTKPLFVLTLINTPPLLDICFPHKDHTSSK